MGFEYLEFAEASKTKHETGEFEEMSGGNTNVRREIWEKAMNLGRVDWSFPGYR